MLGVSSLTTIQPFTLGVVSCLALRHFIAQPSLRNFSPRCATSQCRWCRCKNRCAGHDAAARRRVAANRFKTVPSVVRRKFRTLFPRAVQQGLKPNLQQSGFFGTSKLVPCYKA